MLTRLNIKIDPLGGRVSTLVGSRPTESSTRGSLTDHALVGTTNPKAPAHLASPTPAQPVTGAASTQLAAPSPADAAHQYLQQIRSAAAVPDHPLIASHTRVDEHQGFPASDGDHLVDTPGAFDHSAIGHNE